MEAGHRIVDMEEKLVKLFALEATFNHFTNEHWIPLQAMVIVTNTNTHFKDNSSVPRYS